MTITNTTSFHNLHLVDRFSRWFPLHFVFLHVCPCSSPSGYVVYVLIKELFTKETRLYTLFFSCMCLTHPLSLKCSSIKFENVFGFVQRSRVFLSVDHRTSLPWNWGKLDSLTVKETLLYSYKSHPNPGLEDKSISSRVAPKSLYHDTLLWTG